MFRGSIVALVTPMKADGELDHGALERLLEFHLASGTRGVVIAGTTGEAPTLDRDELEDLRRFLDRVIRMVKVPLMIDSTDAGAIAEALPFCQGKAVINSISMKEGEEPFIEQARKVLQYGFPWYSVKGK